MRMTTSRQHLGLITALALLMTLVGCSQDPMQADGPDGVVTLEISWANTPSPAGPDAVAPLPVDSAAVLVFRPGGAFEAAGGERVGGGGAVAISVACIAENNKRIGVNLYYRGAMIYHGAKTGVDVVAKKNTDVFVDVEEIGMGGVSIAPATVAEGELFYLAWNSVPAAKFYKIQESTTPEFGDDVVFESVVLDTVVSYSRNRGAHYFRIAPATPYALGTYSAPEHCYVMSGGNVTEISTFSVLEVIPGEEFTIGGENLDFPGIEVYIGQAQCAVVSSQWDQITVRIPRNAVTAPIHVGSPLGWDQSPIDLAVQRIAYVSATGAHFAHYKEFIEYYLVPKGVGVYEQVATALVPIGELDWRDMSVFDVIVIAGDTGTDPWDWGGGVPSRAQAIVGSNANILAIGIGGAAFLTLTVPSAQGLDMEFSEQTQIYVPDGSLPELSLPYWVVDPGPGTFQFCTTPEPQIALPIDTSDKPVGVELYGQLFLGHESWPLAGFTVTRVQKTVRHYFWGYAGDPYALTGQAADCFSNLIYYLYGGSGIVIPTASSRRGR